MLHPGFLVSPMGEFPLVNFEWQEHAAKELFVLILPTDWLRQLPDDGLSSVCFVWVPSVVRKRGLPERLEYYVKKKKRIQNLNTMRKFKSNFGETF